MKLTNKISALILLLLSLAMLSSCLERVPTSEGQPAESGSGTDFMQTTESQPNDSEATPDDLGFKLEMPSEELQQRFVKEYLAYQHALYPTHYDLENPPDVAIEYWYGSFGDIHFLFVYDPLKLYSQAEVIEYIAGHRFHYSSSHTMRVWVDGEFWSIKEAYEQNLITEEMVATIANIRNGSDGRHPIKLR